MADKVKAGWRERLRAKRAVRKRERAERSHAERAQGLPRQGSGAPRSDVSSDPRSPGRR
jgi:hypothetical protein